jgi:hypothetical protein
MMRTAFALLALATLAKNDASGRCRLANVCAEMLRAFAALRPHCVDVRIARCRRDVGNWAASFSRCHAGPGLVGRKAVASS